MSPPSWYDAFNVVYGIALVLGGWVLRSIWDAVQDLRKAIADLERIIPNTYARRDDMGNMFTQIMNMLRDIQNKLDSKQDKE